MRQDFSVIRHRITQRNPRASGVAFRVYAKPTLLKVGLSEQRELQTPRFCSSSLSTGSSTVRRHAHAPIG
jgi:hypothetical protein